MKIQGKIKKRKKLKKGVDKRGMIWYSNKAVGAVSTAPQSEMKKHLTAATRCGNLKWLPLR